MLNALDKQKHKAVKILTQGKVVVIVPEPAQ